MKQIKEEATNIDPIEIADSFLNYVGKMRIIGYRLHLSDGKPPRQFFEHIIDANNCMNRIGELIRFYSQPFNVEMLANPIEKYVGGMRKGIDDVKQKEWKGTEKKVLFEGMTYHKVKQRNGVDVTIESERGDTLIEWYNDGTMWILDGMSVNGRGEQTRQPATLDQLIIKFHEYSLGLKWKPEIVKKYFKV